MAKPSCPDLLAALRSTRAALDASCNVFDNSDNDALTEAVIYEIKALRLKYHYLLGAAREAGLHSSDIGGIWIERKSA